MKRIVSMLLSLVLILCLFTVAGGSALAAPTVTKDPVGDTISVYKANMIIPQIADNLSRGMTETKDGQPRRLAAPPDKCPVCGQKTEVFIEGFSPEDQVWVGRTRGDAPNVDGLIFVNSPEELHSGDLVSVRITGAGEYDLIGEYEYETAEEHESSDCRYCQGHRSDSGGNRQAVRPLAT